MNLAKSDYFSKNDPSDSSSTKMVFSNFNLKSKTNMILNSRPSNLTLKKKETTQELNETQNSFEYYDLR